MGERPSERQARSHWAQLVPADMDTAEAEIDFDQEWAEQQEQLQEANEPEEHWECRECEDPVVLGAYSTPGKPLGSTELCPRCESAEETTSHQLWECKANEEIPGAHLELLPEARDLHLEVPCFWLRGLPPTGWI